MKKAFLSIISLAFIQFIFAQNALDQLKGIVLRLEYSYGLGGAVTMEYQPYLFFKDGSFFSNPTESLLTFDIEASKSTQSKYWGTWTQDGKTIQIEKNIKGKLEQKTWEDNWFWAEPAKKFTR